MSADIFMTLPRKALFHSWKASDWADMGTTNIRVDPIKLTTCNPSTSS